MFHLDARIAALSEGRVKPRIPLARVVGSFLLMLWVRIGSLHGVEQARPGGRWRRWLGGPLPPADTLGRVAAGMEPDGVREALAAQYAVRKRNKSLRPWRGGVLPLVLDGHEMHASYRRSCPKCLTRTLQTAAGGRVQYYHRYVAAMLLYDGGELLLDLEPLRPGEDEIAAATRLFLRVVRRYPRAFHVVAGDALYLNPDLCRLIRSHGKHFVAVLKNEHRDLLTDARSLFPEVPPVTWEDGSTRVQAWDIEGFRTWTQYGHAVRVVRTLEARTVRRQLSGELEEVRSEWVWATSLPAQRAATRLVTRIGHGRWSIENQGFNDLVTAWHGDHLYKHDPTAIEVLLLLLFLAVNLFLALLTRNLKPALRTRYTRLFLAHQIHADFYHGLGLPSSGHPP